ncbi:Josephin-1 [Cichlidogyrus casuarinus]|uniref:ubiquitinyl hydrolase 1 n=1 Tax=Cichlidogyrus casuarinus TaxID=1844966 RepID=A0ABD2QGE0_9PLAT
MIYPWNVSVATMDQTAYADLNEVYHEKQSRMLCMLHAINNLLQGRASSKEELDSICIKFDDRQWNNEHRNPFGLGNYDVNVLTECLARKGYDLVWYNKSKGFEDNLKNDVLGFIVNVPSWMSLFGVPLPFKGAHWFAIRQLKVNNKEEYYNLDSKLPKPTVIAPDRQRLNSYIDELLFKSKSASQTHLFIVRPVEPTYELA